MELSQYVDEPTLAALQRLLPDVPFQPILTPLSGSADRSLSVELPVPADAEYAFRLYLHQSGRFTQPYLLLMRRVISGICLSRMRHSIIR